MDKKPTKPSEVALVEVLWEDAWGCSDLLSFTDETLNETVERRSVGFLIKTRPHILLCASPYADFEKGQDFTLIPRKLVKEIHELERKKEA